MVNSKTVWLLQIAALLLLSSCREPELTAEWQPDGGDFDAGEDDAGPGELCAPDSPDLFNNAYSPYIGGTESVDLVVVNYGYFFCPHCETFAAQYHEAWATNDELMSRVRIYFHHYPFDNDASWEMHAAAVAAYNQGMDAFWGLHDYICDDHEDIEDVLSYADEVLGLDMDQVAADMADPDTKTFLEWDKSQAQAQGATGAPSVYICGEKVNWGSAVEEALSYL